MKKIFLLLLILAVHPIKAQVKAEVTKSEILKDPKRSLDFLELIYSLEDEKGGVIFIRYTANRFERHTVTPLKYYIQHFDADLKLVKEVEHEAGFRKRIKNAFVKDGKLCDSLTLPNMGCYAKAHQLYTVIEISL